MRTKSSTNPKPVDSSYSEAIMTPIKDFIYVVLLRRATVLGTVVGGENELLRKRGYRYSCLITIHLSCLPCFQRKSRPLQKTVKILHLLQHASSITLIAYFASHPFENQFDAAHLSLTVVARVRFPQLYSHFNVMNIDIESITFLLILAQRKNRVCKLVVYLPEHLPSQIHAGF